MAIRGKNYAGYNIMQVDASTNPVCKAGTTVLADDGNFYRYVYNNSATTGVVQYGCVVASAATATDFKVVVATRSNEKGLEAGIVVATLGTYEYGWACVRGAVIGTVTAQVDTARWALDMAGAGSLTPAAGATTANNAARDGTPYFSRATRTNAGTLMINVNVW